MITMTSVEMWSDVEQAMVTWSVTREQEEIDGHLHAAIVTRHNEEIHRFSPSTTDQELLNMSSDPSGTRRR